MTNNEIYKTIGCKIRQVRLIRGMSQNELAKQIALSRPSIINIENGIHRIQIHTLVSIAKALNVTFISLLLDITENDHY